MTAEREHQMSDPLAAKARDSYYVVIIPAAHVGALDVAAARELLQPSELITRWALEHLNR